MRRLRSVPALVPALVTALATAALLGGCGDATDDDQAGDAAGSSQSSSPAPTESSATPSPTAATSSVAPQLPSCDSVWVDGQELPFSYRACIDGPRTVRAQRQPCEMGKPLVTYQNSFWAVAGGPVHQVDGTLAKDAGWHRALIQCGG